MKDQYGHGSNPRGAREEKVALGQRVDLRHFPILTADKRQALTEQLTDRQAAQALAQGHPKSETVPLGKSFEFAQAALARGRTTAVPRGTDFRRKS